VGDSEQNRGLIDRWIGTAAVAALAIACLLILRPFVSAMLWAAVLCFTTWPLFIRLKARVGGRPTMAASLATLALSAIIIVPVAILVSRISNNVAEIIEATRNFIRLGPAGPPAWIAALPLVGSRLADYWKLLSEGSAAGLSGLVKWLPTVQKALLGSGRALAEGVIKIIFSLLMVFFFYRNGETAVDRLISTINRIGGAQGPHLLEVAGTTMRAVVYGVLGSALVQGVLAGTGYMIAGVPGAALLGFVTFIVAVIPGGPLLVAAPAVLWLYYRASAEWAFFILIWMVIVSGLDHVVRPLLIASGGGNTPVILVILGVLGGAMAFGVIGLFLGPTFLAVGYSLFDEWSSQRQQFAADRQRKSRC
jgi:predicted PurR-regulated permease PerM